MLGADKKPGFVSLEGYLVGRTVIAALEKAGKLKRIPFADRDQLKKLVDPVMASYAKEIGADQILAKINAIN